MARLGIVRDDLAVFGMGDAAARAERLRYRIAPLLDSIAIPFVPALSALAGRPLSLRPCGSTADTCAAVRFVPPDGEQESAHLLLALNRSGVHARLRVPSGCPHREACARRLARCTQALARELGGADLRRYDDGSCASLPAPGAPAEPSFWRELAEDLATASGALDVGTAWPEARAVMLCRADLVAAFRPLASLWKRLEG